MIRMTRILRLLPCLMLLAVMALAGCMTLSGSSQPPGQSGAAQVQVSPTPAASLARIDAGAAWLDASVAKITAAIGEAQQQTPSLDTAQLKPAVEALKTLVASYGTAVAVGDVPKAETMWPDARKAVSTAILAAGQVLGPQLLTLLGV